MNANTFGTHFRVTTFGESHGVALGAVIDGCPAGVDWDESLLAQWMDRRKPGQKNTSARREPDRVEVLSGVYEGKTLGTPIALVVRNQDARSSDYQNVVRAGHADDLWPAKFGHADPRGGGRASGRETVARVMAAALAQMFLRKTCPELEICSYLTQVGPLELPSQEAELTPLLNRAAEAGESYGARIALELRGATRGIGQPVFRKLKADLAGAWMGVGAVNAVEFGDGAKAASAQGTEFHHAGNSYGGIRGGLATGEPIVARVSIKPTSSIGVVARQGRHDPCIGIRAMPVLEAMAWLVIADHELWRRLDRA